jgi:hypothetical protein
VTVRNSRTASSPCMRLSRTSMHPRRTRNVVSHTSSAGPLPRCFGGAISVINDCLYVGKSDDSRGLLLRSSRARMAPNSHWHCDLLDLAQTSIGGRRKSKKPNSRFISWRTGSNGQRCWRGHPKSFLLPLDYARAYCFL